MQILNLYEAKTQLSKLVSEVLDGKEIIIAKAGVPKVKLVPVDQSDNGFEFGVMRGEMSVSSDFDAPLPEEILALFEDKAQHEIIA